MTTAAAPRAFVVWFRDLARWDIAFFRQLRWHWPPNVIRPLGSALRRKRVEVDPDVPRESVPIIEKISFGGTLSVTKPADRIGYKGRLFWADAGDLVYSKIRVKQGSLCLVPELAGRIAVSPEYPVFEVDTDSADGRYLELVIRSSGFMGVLEGLSHGGSTKTRIPPEEFERLTVPLPPINTQRAIIATWESAQRELATTRAKIAMLEERIEADFLADLGLSKPARAALPKCFVVPWHEFERWSVSYNQLAQTAVDITKSKYPIVTLGSCVTMMQYGTSEKANSVGRGSAILRINNIKGGALDTSDLKHLPLPDKTRASLLLQDGDILVIRTSGSRDLVGTCAVFHERGEYVFASYLIRFRVETSTAYPDFVARFLNSPLGRQQVDAVSRQIMQSNINSDEIRSLEIPLPPHSEQSAIMQRVRRGQIEIAALRTSAAAREREAKADVEAMILGTKPVGAD